MIKVFLDANIYFTASRSPSGGSSVICELIKQRRLTLFATRQVLKEAKRNLGGKEDIKVNLRFYDLLNSLKPKIVNIKKQEAEENFTKIINQKDCLVLEGAKIAKVKFLVTLDRKDFFTKEIKEAKLPFEIITPGELIKKLAKGKLPYAFYLPRHSIF